MNSKFNINSEYNFPSDSFPLAPSSNFFFGQNVFDRMNSLISRNSSFTPEKKIVHFDSQRFKFDSGIFFEKRNDSSDNFKKENENNHLGNRDSNSVGEGNVIKPNVNYKYFTKGLEKSSKTILCPLNTCLINLALNDNYNNNSNSQLDLSCSSDRKSSFSNSINEVLYCNNTKIIKENNNNNIINKKEKMDNLNNFRGANNNSENSCPHMISPKIAKLINPSVIIAQRNCMINSNPREQGSAFKKIAPLSENPFQFPANRIFTPPQHKLSLSINPPPSSLISNITNVTNNYFFQINNNTNSSTSSSLLKQKTKRISPGKSSCSIIDSINVKKQKERKKYLYKKDDSYGLYQLNQICVNGVSISKFPVISMNEEDTEVQILTKILTETDFFTIVDKYYINIPVLDEEKYNRTTYAKVFKKEKEKIKDLYLIEENVNENNPIKLIRNFYYQIKNTILTIQSNFLTNCKKTLGTNYELCKVLERLITSCNSITNTVTDYKKSGLKRKVFHNSSENEISKDIQNNKGSINNSSINNEDSALENMNNKKSNDIINNNNEKQKRISNEANKSNNESINDRNINNNPSNNSNSKQKQKHFKTYLCEFCNKAYSNGQGLGGHMSRIHPNQSYKYKDKIRIRREREKKRENLLKIKRELFNKYGYNFDSLNNNKEKCFIQQFLHAHSEEYKMKRKGQQKNNFKCNINDNREISLDEEKDDSQIKFEIKNEDMDKSNSKEKTNDKTNRKSIEENENESNKNSKEGGIKVFGLEFESCENL